MSKDTTDSTKLQFVTDLERKLYEALKAMMAGNHSRNERGVWGCVRTPSNEDCSMAYIALCKARKTRTPIDIMSDDEGEQS